MTIPGLVPATAGVIPLRMEEPQNYRVQIRQYPRAGGITWRWWVFDRRGGTHLDTGVNIGGDRVAVERAATYAVELLKQQKQERSPELPANAPRTIQL
jgi:hypothetical protein